MITAVQAKDIADNLNTKAAQELLRVLELSIRDAASKGEFSLDATNYDRIPCVYEHLRTLGYGIEETLDEYNIPIHRRIIWS